MSRTSQIVTRVRLRLKQIDVQNIQDGEIYDIMNYVQNDILAKTKCLENQYTISLVSGSDSYYFPGSASVYIKTLIYNQAGYADQVLWYANTNQWLERYFHISGSPPQYYTQFGNQLKVSPVPLTSGSFLIYGYQNTISYNVTSSAEEPEIPVWFDNALALGVMAEFDPKYFQLYEQALRDGAYQTHNKSSRQLDGVVNW